MSTPKGLVVTSLVAALVALGPLSTDMYLPAFPAMAAYFETGIAEIQLTLSVFLVGFALAQLLYGPLSDRFGRKPMMLAGLVLFTGSSIALAQADSIEAVIALRLLQALGGSAGPVLGRAMVRDIYGPLDAAGVLSYIGTAMALAPAVAPLLGGYLNVWLDWRAIFLFLAAYGALGTWGLIRILPETFPAELRRTGADATLAGPYLAVLRDRSWRWYTLVCSLVFCGLFAFLSGSPFVIIDFLGHPQERFGVFFAFVVFGFMAGTFAGGRLSRRFGINTLILGGALLAAAAGCLMLALALLQVHSAAAVIAPMTAYMAGTGMVMPQAMAGALAPFPQSAGTASALLGFTQMGLAALAGVLVGQFHGGDPLAMAAAIALSGSLTLAFSVRLSVLTASATASAKRPDRTRSASPNRPEESRRR